MSLQPEIEIHLDDVELIMGKHFKKGFKKITESVVCGSCSEPQVIKMEIRKIWLNHIGDIILEGRCQTCSGPVRRYIETGSIPESYEQAMAIRELKIEVLKDFNPRF